MSWCPAEPPAGKGRRPPAEGDGAGKSESGPVRPGQLLRGRISPREPDFIPFATSGRGPLGYVAPQAQLEASLTSYLFQLGDPEVLDRSSLNPHILRHPVPLATWVSERILVLTSLLRGDSVSPLWALADGRGAQEPNASAPPPHPAASPSSPTMPRPQRAPAGERRLLAPGADPSLRGSVRRGEGHRVPAASTPPLPGREVRGRSWRPSGPLPLPPGAATCL